MTLSPQTWVPLPTGRRAVATALLAGCLAAPADAQDRGRTVQAGPAPRVDAATTTDWPLHNLNLHNSRFAEPDQITTGNVGSLELKWSHATPPRSIIRSATPLVIDGIMYFNSGSVLTALNAATGEPVWTFEAEPAFAGGGRGPAYADGRIYAFGPEIMYAVDARTGELVETFGDRGHLQVAQAALTFKYPDQYPPDVDTTAMGFAMTNPPTAAGGNLFIGLPFSEGLLPGGLLGCSGRHDRRGQVGVQHHSAESARRRLGNCERYVERREAATVAACGCRPRWTKSWAWSTSTPPTRRPTTMRHRGSA